MIESSLLQAIDLGSLRFPSDPSQGCATLKINGEYKIDVQKPAGKNDPKLTGVGIDARHVSIEMWWTTRIDVESRAFIKQISPVGINAGKAWEISHPDADIYSFNSIQFTNIGEFAREAGKVSITFEALSWKKPAAAKKGTGTKTATKAEEWRNVPIKGAAGHITHVTSDGNTVDMGPGPEGITIDGGKNAVGGFGGPEAPKAEVP